MKHWPTTVAQFDKRRDEFSQWLAGRGSAALAPTNPFEVMRFNGPTNVCIIYRNGANTITPKHWVNGADVAFGAFLTQGPWRALERSARDRRTDQMVMTLAARDGWDCLYCGKVLDLECATLEHIVPLTSGGPDHPANMTLVHAVCNSLAGHLSAREKFEIALRGRWSTEDRPPA